MAKDNYPVTAVVGPTATGKTVRALEIAAEMLIGGKVAGVDLISVDSRQVYQGLEVLTGADVPEGFERISTQCNNYFANCDDSIRLYGVSIIKPSDEWSVAHFLQYARNIMIDSWHGRRLPILVGGTGLYHQKLFAQDKRLQVPPNDEVRKRAEQMSVGDLQEWLGEVDHERLAMMNQSDRGNKRRLVRAIEVGIVDNQILNRIDWFGSEQRVNEFSEENSWEILNQTPILKPSPLRGLQQVRVFSSARVGSSVRDNVKLNQAGNDDRHSRSYAPESPVLHDGDIDWFRIKPAIVSVSADLDLIKEKIEKRVKERFENGAIGEVKRLLSLDLSPTLPVMTTLGVPEITSYLKKEISAKECQKLWSLHEFQYAKRQLTWWKV